MACNVDSIVWVKNPYPLTDSTHWTKALPQSARPEWVPAVVTSVANEHGYCSVETIWEPPLPVLEVATTKLLPTNGDAVAATKTSGGELSALDQLNEPALLHDLQARIAPPRPPATPPSAPPRASERAPRRGLTKQRVADERGARRAKQLSYASPVLRAPGTARLWRATRSGSGVTRICFARFCFV
jgi:hypothetical protein